MIIGVCILIGGGVIGTPLAIALSIFFGLGFLYKFWKRSGED